MIGNFFLFVFFIYAIGAIRESLLPYRPAILKTKEQMFDNNQILLWPFVSAFYTVRDAFAWVMTQLKERRKQP